MNSILAQLHEDHKRLVRVLYHLEQEAKAIAGLSPKKGCLETVLDILDYVQACPEVWHHPTEDIIYEALLQKDGVDTQLLADALNEHEVLVLLTENLHERIHQLLAGSGSGAARFAKAANDYVNHQLRHMEFEQKHLFPLMESRLDQKDWQQISATIKSQSSASKNARLQEFSAVYRNISESSALTAH